MVYFRKPGQFKNRRRYPQGGRKRRIGRGIRQLQGLARDVAKVKEAVNVEYKCKDTYLTFNSIPQATYANRASNTSWLAMALNDIVQGTAMNEREGAVIRIKSLQHSCTFDNSVTGSLPCRVRLIFALNLLPVNTLAVPPAPDDVLDFEQTIVDPMMAFRNMSNRSRWVILSDRVVTLTDPTTDNVTKEYKFYRKFNFHTQWSTLDTNGDGIFKNALWMFAFTDQPGAVLPRMRCFNRVRYIDN